MRFYESLSVYNLLLQVVNTTEGMINVAFIDNIKKRKAARAVRNGYAEYFWYQTW